MVEEIISGIFRRSPDGLPLTICTGGSEGREEQLLRGQELRIVSFPSLSETIDRSLRLDFSRSKAAFVMRQIR